MRRVVSLLVLSLTGSILHCHAWGKDGHEIVGNVAWMFVSNMTQYKIEQLLKLSSSSDKNIVNATTTTDCVGYCSPLALVADWADIVRHTKQYQWSAPLHYIDIRDDEILPNGCPIINTTDPISLSTTSSSSSSCHFNIARDCPDDFCVAGAIVNFTDTIVRNYNAELLLSPSSSSFINGIQSNVRGRNLQQQQQQQQPTSNNNLNKFPCQDLQSILQDSLRFIVHFIGDIHQPLHCSRQSDKGGNTILVHFQSENDTTSVLSESIRRPRDYYYYNDKNSATNDSSYNDNRTTRLTYPLNLHGFWDDTIIDKLIQDHYNQSRNVMEQALYDYIINTKTNNPNQYYTEWIACADGNAFICTKRWGEESFQYAMEYAYKNIDGTEIESGTTLSIDYYTTRVPIVQERLAVAGLRLAITLNLLFDTSYINK